VIKLKSLLVLFCHFTSEKITGLTGELSPLLRLA